MSVRTGSTIAVGLQVTTQPPLAATDPRYSSVLVAPGLAILRGEEQVQWDGAEPQRCAFVRCYRLTARGWGLHLAQWHRPTEAP